MEDAKLTPLLRRAAVTEWLRREGLSVSTIRELFASRRIVPRQISAKYAHYERDQIARDILQKGNSK